MANCPNCGSDHIQLRRDTDINWGRAITGYALFGVLGGAVAAVTGEDRSANACIECGTIWKAKDLYEIRQTIQRLIGVSLDLSQEKHRLYLKSFISEFSLLLSKVADIDIKAKEKIVNLQSNLGNATTKGYTYGCGFFLFFSFIFIPIIADGYISSWLVILFCLILIAAPFAGYKFALHEYKSVRKKNEKEIAKIKKEAEMRKLDLEEHIKNKIENFKNRHSISQ